MKEFSEQLEYFKKENTAKDNEIAFLEKKLKEANEEEKVCFIWVNRSKLSYKSIKALQQYNTVYQLYISLIMIYIFIILSSLFM